MLKYLDVKYTGYKVYMSKSDKLTLVYNIQVERPDPVQRIIYNFDMLIEYIKNNDISSVTSPDYSNLNIISYLAFDSIYLSSNQFDARI